MRWFGIFFSSCNIKSQSLFFEGGGGGGHNEMSDIFSKYSVR